MLLLHLLSGDHCLLIDFTLGHLASRFAWRLLLLLLLLLVLILLGALAGAGVNARLVVVALPKTGAEGGAGVADACPNAGLLPFEELPAERMTRGRV